MLMKRQQQHGIALVIVLWIITLLAIMAGSFAYSMRTETTLAVHAVEQARARALAEAGIAFAALNLLITPDPEDPWPIEGSVREWTFGQGVAQISVIDAAGKIDLNNGKRELLVGLLESAGVAADEAVALVDKIEDFRDADDATRLNGAEDDDYEAAGLLAGAKDAPFERVDELMQVLGMTPALYQQIAAALTVFSRQPGVNPEAASAQVLYAIPDVDAQLIDDYLQLREQALAEDQPLPPAPPLGAYLARKKGIAYHVTIDAVLQSGAKTVVEAVIARRRRPEQAYSISSWREDK